MERKRGERGREGLEKGLKGERQMTRERSIDYWVLEWRSREERHGLWKGSWWVRTDKKGKKKA